ncbi:MAG: hypothetical protein HFH69_11455 [Lachnospiraceae bacterium]|nr:hypothetical protein [Lachnospiraceae bacterium]
MDLSRVFGKKVGDFNKKESKNLDFTGLKIPRDYFEGREEKRLSISDMAELIRIHDTYKALNSALLGGELSLGFDSGYIGALGRVYKVIDDNIPRSMKAASIEILGDTSIEPEQREKMLLQGKNR